MAQVSTYSFLELRAAQYLSRKGIKILNTLSIFFEGVSTYTI